MGEEIIIKRNILSVRHKKFDLCQPAKYKYTNVQTVKYHLPWTSFTQFAQLLFHKKCRECATDFVPSRRYRYDNHLTSIVIGCTLYGKEHLLGSQKLVNIRVLISCPIERTSIRKFAPYPVIWCHPWVKSFVQASLGTKGFDNFDSAATVGLLFALR